MAGEVEFAAGEIIYQKGDMGRAVYLIEEGQVDVEMNIPGGASITINTFGPGRGSASAPPAARVIRSTRHHVPSHLQTSLQVSSHH